MGQHQFAEFAAALLAQPQRAPPEQAAIDPFAQGQPGGIGHIARRRLGKTTEQRAHDQY